MGVGIRVSGLNAWFGKTQALRDIDLAQAWAAFGHIQPGIFLIGLVPWLVAIGSKVFRWRLLYHPDERQALQHVDNR